MKLSSRKTAAGLLVAALIVSLCTPWSLKHHRVLAGSEDYRLATVTRRPFNQTLRRTGVIAPVKEHHVISKLWGTILDIAPQGKRVEKDEIVLRIDPAPHEEEKTNHEAYMASLRAQFKKAIQESKKGINQAREDVASFDLRVELEKMRLEDLKKGPTTTEAINARVTLENSKSLLEALEDEVKVLESLSSQGYVSKEELRTKQLELKEQQLKVADADIAQRKLYIADPVKLAEQELKVRDAIKTRDAAAERVTLLEKNLERDNDSRKRTMDREEIRLKNLVENIDKTIYKSPAPGIVIYKKARWYAYAPGRDVGDGWEIMGLPDSTRMKVTFAVDEARVALVTVGLNAGIVPAGWRGEPFKGKVTKVADKGRDEFESYKDDTTQIIGTANRQVFDVDVEIDGNSPVFFPGLRANVEVVLNSFDSALVVPRAAVFRDPDGDPTLRVQSSGTTEIRKIKLVASTELFAVVEGVQEGERVWIVAESK